MKKESILFLKTLLKMFSFYFDIQLQNFGY